MPYESNLSSTQRPIWRGSPYSSAERGAEKSDFEAMAPRPRANRDRAFAVLPPQCWQGGAFSASLIGSGGDPGSIVVNPYFWGSACNGTGYYMAVHTYNNAGAPADRYFVYAKL